MPSILDLILTNEENMVEKNRLSTKFGENNHEVLSFNFNCSIEKVLSSQKRTTLTREIMSHV